ncbi:MAG: hypothetical protein ACK5L4_16765, partial [Pseudanabaena sp.]
LNLQVNSDTHREYALPNRLGKKTSKPRKYLDSNLEDMRGGALRRLSYSLDYDKDISPVWHPK